MLVGINSYKYPDRVPSLAGAINDVEAMKEVLAGRFDFPRENLATLKNEQATHAAIVAGIQQLIAKAKPDDIVVFYYSGHGSQLTDTSGDETDGMDETLVPYDSRDPARKVFDISDDELNGLFLQLSSKTKNLTVILDSCHSGTGLRSAPEASLRVKEAKPDLRTPPAQKGGGGFAADGFQYALISAATERQLAFEHSANGVQRGILSFFLTQALSRPDLRTYRDVMDVVRAQVNGLYPNQMPQLEGAAANRAIFGDSGSLPLPYFPVLASSPGRASLAGGQVHGITTGSLFEIYPPGSKKFSPPEQPIANLRITEVSSFTSEAEVQSDQPVPLGARAVEKEHRFDHLRLRVYLHGLELSSLRKELAAEKHIEMVTDASLCHVQVKLQRGLFSALTSDGFPLSPPVPTAEKLAGQLSKWAKWYNLHHLDNIRGPEVQFDADDASSLKDRDKLELRVENKSSRDLYISILDLSTDGSIEVSYPPDQGAAELLPAGGSITHRLEMFVPEGRSTVRDTFKLFASTKPIDLRPITQEGIKGAPDLASSGDPLNDLLAESAGKLRGSRPVDTGQWTTRQRTVTVRR